MITILFFLAMQVATPSEMACVGSVQNEVPAASIIVSGVREEGTATMAAAGEIIYIEGPGVARLKSGAIQRVIRPEGGIKGKIPGALVGIYIKDVGRIQIEAIRQGSATARIISVCQAVQKGDLVLPEVNRPVVEFNGEFSSETTRITKDLMGSIFLGKDDLGLLATGHFCFIDLGKRDGVKPGDRFTVFRPHPSFNPQDLSVSETKSNASYFWGGVEEYKNEVDSTLRQRTLPAKVLGDVIVVDVDETASTVRIINSLLEMNPGDFVMRRNVK
jgi:hypothetical protein